MRLKEFRKANQLTQEKVASLLGLPTKTYQNYEREVREPDSVVLCKLADLYGVTVDEILGRNAAIGDQRSETISEIDIVFEQLNEDGRAMLLDYARYLVSSDKYMKKEMPNYQISSNVATA